MKRSILITAIMFGVTILVISAVTIMGPLTGKVFSTINAPLSYRQSESYAVEPAIGGGAPAQPPAADFSTGAAGFDNGQKAQDAVDGQTGQDRLVIKNAGLTIVVKDPAAKMQAIASMAETMGGFVVSSSVGETYAPDGSKVPDGSMLVRIPAPKLDEALKEIKSDAVEVQNETQSGQDVTKEYTDLQSQLKNLEATEQQLTLIMQKADKTEDVLAVFNQLTQIRGQIEVIKGQMQYYEQSAALSAVSIRLIAEKTIEPIKIAGWEPQGVARDAVQDLVNFFQGFVDFLIRLVLFVLPAAVLVFLPLYLIYLGVRAIIRRGRAKTGAGQ